ncbi:Replication factor-A carboxy-terminal domain protein [Arachis hypogaea]|nr:Replication factor-A carboxy-terminal domain protein [Arachis hypogaea]
MPPPFDMISKMHPPREAWRLKVRVLRLWVVPSFGNHEVPNSMEMILLDEHCGKIQAAIKKPLLNRFRDHIVEGQVYRMAYFTVVSNHVGEEKEYAKEGKILKMIVLELTSKDLTVRCALFGDYVNQVNYFLASGYVEQPVVVIQLAKVKFFRGQVGLQNVIYATQMLFNPNLPEVVEFTQSMIEQGVNGTQPLFIANEGKVVSLEDDFMRLTRKCTIEELQDSNEGIYPQNGAYYCDFCLKHITNVTPRFKIKITLEDHSGEGIFVFFDREASYLLKKSCADLFTELICGDTYPPIFQGLIGKKLLLKVDTKGVAHDTFYGTFQVRRICDDPTIIAMFELPDYDADNESTPKKPAVFGGTEFAALINDEDGKDEKTPNNDTEVLSHVLDPPSQYGEKLIHENHVVTSKGKKNLNPQFEEAATDADGRGSKIAKVNGV